MSDERLNAEEFARLMALPENHPDRVTAEQSTAFVAMRVLFTEFEAGRTPLPSETDAEAARLELMRRVAPAVVARRSAAATDSRGVLGRWLDALRTPAVRVGLAFASVILVAGVAWWMQTQPRTEMMRGPEREAGAFHSESPRASGDQVVLSWSPVPEADAYRVVFLGGDLAEVARLEAGPGTRLTLHSASLPAGLVRGADVSFEVIALANGEPIATTPARTITLP